MINKNIKMKKDILLFVVIIENLKILKYYTFSKKYEFFLLFTVSVTMKKKKFREEESIKI